MQNGSGSLSDISVVLLISYLCVSIQFGNLFTGGGFGLWTVVAVVLLIAFPVDAVQTL